MEIHHKIEESSIPVDPTICTAVPEELLHSVGSSSIMAVVLSFTLLAKALNKP